MDEDRVKYLRAEARDCVESGKFLRAVAITDQLAMLVPDDSEVAILQAKALLGSGGGEDALEKSRRAVELNPESGSAHILLGVAAWRAGRLTLAQESMQRAIELSGSAPGILADYAWFMASERGPRPAEEAAEEALAADASCSTAWAALALAQYRLRRREDAERSVAKALQLDPNDPYAMSVQVTMLQERGEEDRAMALAEVLEGTPGTEEFVEEVRQRNREKAVERLLVERGVDLNPAPEPSGLVARLLVLLVAIAVVAGLLIYVRPSSPVGVFSCCFGPLVVYWFWVFRTS